MVFPRNSELTESLQEKRILKAGCLWAQGSVGNTVMKLEDPPAPPPRWRIGGQPAGRGKDWEGGKRGGTWERWQHLSLVALIDALRAQKYKDVFVSKICLIVFGQPFQSGSD